MFTLFADVNAPYWFQAFSLALNVVQVVALAYVSNKWRRANGALNDLTFHAERMANAAHVTALVSGTDAEQERPPRGT